MVNSVSSVSSSSSVQSTNQLSEEEKKKTEEDGLFSEDTQQTTQDNSSSTTLSEDTTKSTARSYIASLKAQYPQLASKLDSYLSNLDFTTLCSEATSVSDVKAYIYSETQGFFK